MSPVPVFWLFLRDLRELRQSNLQSKTYFRHNNIGAKIFSHYRTLLFQMNFPDYVLTLYIAELVSNYFLGYVISCVVAKQTMWTSDYIT